MLCDASTTTYAAIFYVRERIDDRMHTQKLKAKTRVAPIKTLSVPRSELCAALLGEKLSQAVKKPSRTAFFLIQRSLLGRIHK